jgi:hypothetical protein
MRKPLSVAATAKPERMPEPNKMRRPSRRAQLSLALATLTELTQSGEKESTRLAAAQALLDRLLGAGRGQASAAPSRILVSWAESGESQAANGQGRRARSAKLSAK